jgi:hypothetical protein
VVFLKVTGGPTRSSTTRSEGSVRIRPRYGGELRECAAWEDTLGEDRPEGQPATSSGIRPHIFPVTKLLSTSLEREEILMYRRTCHPPPPMAMSPSHDPPSKAGAQSCSGSPPSNRIPGRSPIRAVIFSLRRTLRSRQRSIACGRFHTPHRAWQIAVRTQLRDSTHIMVKNRKDAVTER